MIGDCNKMGSHGPSRSSKNFRWYFSRARIFWPFTSCGSGQGDVSVIDSSHWTEGRLTVAHKKIQETITQLWSRASLPLVSECRERISSKYGMGVCSKHYLTDSVLFRIGTAYFIWNTTETLSILRKKISSCKKFVRNLNCRSLYDYSV
jgi:hypothetical protein